MALLSSTMMPLGHTAPDFALPTPQGVIVTRDSACKAKGLLVVFMCNHCPYVIHLKAALAQAAKQLFAMDIGMVGINANDVENYPQDSPQAMQHDIDSFGYTFHYLYDQTQTVARNYDAVCTPDFFLFDGALKLVYRGQFDDSRPGDEDADGTDLYRAVEALISGRRIPDEEQKPSTGCSIKWKL